MNLRERNLAPTNTISGINNTLDMLTFTVGEQSYSLPVTHVVRIIEMVTITQLPGVPDIIQGVINVQGKTVPVMDLRRRFGLPVQPYGLHTPIILTDNGNGQIIGLVVDTVEDVVNVPHAQLEMSEAILPAELERQMINQTAYLAGVAKMDRQMIVVLNAKALLTLTEQTTLYQVLDGHKSSNHKQ